MVSLLPMPILYSVLGFVLHFALFCFVSSLLACPFCGLRSFVCIWMWIFSFIFVNLDVNCFLCVLSVICWTSCMLGYISLNNSEKGFSRYLLKYYLSTYVSIILMEFWLNLLDLFLFSMSFHLFFLFIFSFLSPTFLATGYSL